MNDASTASKQFAENLRIFGNPQSQPEKYNLYAGLMNLANTISNLQSEVESLKKQISQVSSSVSYMKSQR